jgi:hypothetical protein
MYAVIRRYSGQGATQMMDELQSMTGEVESIIKGVPGFVCYSLLRTGDGGASVSIFQDKSGADESSRRAAAFISERMSHAAIVAAEKSDGQVLLHMDAD